MMHFKRLSCFLLSVILLFTLFPSLSPAYAEGGADIGNEPCSQLNLPQADIGVKAVYTAFEGSEGFALNVMRNGIQSKTDDITSYNGKLQPQVYWGYQFSRAYGMNQVKYTAGSVSPAGGWYGSIPKIQVLQHGKWVDVAHSKISPAYPCNNTAGPGKTYTFTFDPTWGDGVRIIGIPAMVKGKNFSFTSLGELAVYYTDTVADKAVDGKLSAISNGKNDHLNLAKLNTVTQALSSHPVEGDLKAIITDGNTKSGVDRNTYNGKIQGRTWWGLEFSKVYGFNRLLYTIGDIGPSGGRFREDVKVQVRQNGAWKDVTGLKDDYVMAEARLRETYAFSFNDTWGDAIRIIGVPNLEEGKTFSYTSVAELQVYFANVSPPQPAAHEGSYTMPFVVSILLEGGSQATTLEELRTVRRQMFELDSKSRVSWGLNMQMVFDSSNVAVLSEILNYVDLYGDEISFGYGFPNNNTDLEGWKTWVNEWLYMYRYNMFPDIHEHGTMGQRSVWESIPEKYRPRSVTTYAINQEQAQWLKDTYGVDAFMGWAATQTYVDQLTGDGSPLMPYYAHINHSLVPAQDTATNTGCVFLNCITVDPIGCRYTSGESRWTIHPADPLISGALSQKHIFDAYLNNPYKSRNSYGAAYFSLIIDTNWIMRSEGLLKSWNETEAYIRDKGLKICGVDEFVQDWQNHNGSGNDSSEFTLLIQGSGQEKWGNSSPADTQYLWTETKSERLVLSKTEAESTWKVIDFTDFAKESIPVMPYTTDGNKTNVGYSTGRNYKFDPDAPLAEEDKDRIRDRLTEIGFNKTVDEISEAVPAMPAPREPMMTLWDTSRSIIVNFVNKPALDLFFQPGFIDGEGLAGQMDSTSSQVGFDILTGSEDAVSGLGLQLTAQWVPLSDLYETQVAAFPPSGRKVEITSFSKPVVGRFTVPADYRNKNLAVCRLDKTTGELTCMRSYFKRETNQVYFLSDSLADMKYVLMENTREFEDLRNSWARPFILPLYSMGAMNGVSRTRFGFEALMTRGDFLRIGMITLGLDAPSSRNFADVPPSKYYARQIAAAKELGIITQDYGQAFYPDRAITREELMVFAFRMMRAVGLDIKAGTAADLKQYTDAGRLGKEALGAFGALVRDGLVTGSGKNLYPERPATRAEAATILYKIFVLQFERLTGDEMKH